MKPSRIETYKRIAFSLALVVVLNIFFNVGIATFYPSPQYDDYCNESEPYLTEPTEEERIAMNEYYDQCQADYRAAREPHERNVFIVLVVLGFVTFLVGLFLHSNRALANGFMYGGILSVIIGMMRYWEYADDYLRFILSTVILVVLIVIGVKKFQERQEKTEAKK